MNHYPQLFFHISKDARIKYNIEKEFFSIRGNIVVADAKAARLLTEKINKVRNAEGRVNELVSAGQINTLALLHEIFHFIIRYYEDNENPGVFSRGINYLKKNLNELELNLVLSEFVNHFPPLTVFEGKISKEGYLEGETNGKPNKEIILEEIILLHLENNNPASSQLEELYSEKPLAQKTKYRELIDFTEKFFNNEKVFGEEKLPLIHFLRKPLIDSPFNLDKQLDYILNKWKIFIYDRFGKRILKGKDIIYEDSKLFLQHAGTKATPPVPVYEFDKEYFAKIKAKLAGGGVLTPEESLYYEEYEKFTADVEWMPNVVMIAKNAFVWLDQLSKKYQREIKRLDQIPDEELDKLAEWNFTALWLIGLWERSSASKKIKQIMGNPDAASSAYSLYDYVIANDLGGEDAFNNLKERAWKRGIRLASDMVPNHTGIFSKWIIEKPHYFIQTDSPPYPGYSFTGPNLSDDDRVEIRIEDKYYQMTDAAVVFERRDRYTGDTKYIYHGNDGTHMPWNDTAQLNLLLPEVREALYQMIKHVASKTPIIRFDAAMTLTKKHYQRLWFPLPGFGGAIPSRSDFSMTREEFDKAMPNEFWREVVDRMNNEMPDTLLLAEAFWLMESYFVRTLGMHRVYNSAFMHMIMKEENEKYRLLIKNTLDFNPEILKRYVNFMSNPDEETAVNQFGKGDKYFGVAVMLVTLPGLPMFGHGQIEGFAEKYGMEYKRAYYNEVADENLVERHKHEIFPLLRKRYLFSQVENFELYDFYDNTGNINENVFAFSNRVGNERALIIYNNSYTETHGTIQWSAAKADLSGITVKKLADALALKNEPGIYYAYRDIKTKFEYLVRSTDIHNYGFYIFLKGYDYRACIDFREIFDYDGSWGKLYKHLSGRGVYSLEQELKELQLFPLHESITDFLNPELIKKINEIISGSIKISEIKNELSINIDNVLNHINTLQPVPVDSEKIKESVVKDIESTSQVNNLLSILEKSNDDEFKKINNLLTITKNDSNNTAILLSIFLFNRIFNSNSRAENLFDSLIIGKALEQGLKANSSPEKNVGEDIHLIKILTLKDKSSLWDNIDKQVKGRKQKSSLTKNEFLSALFDGDDVKWFTLVNEYEGNKYFNKEKFELLLDWIFTLKVSLASVKNETTKRKSKKDSEKTSAKSSREIKEEKIKNIIKDYKFFNSLKSASEKAGYKLNELLPVKRKPAKKKKEIKESVKGKSKSNITTRSKGRKPSAAKNKKRGKV